MLSCPVMTPSLLAPCHWAFQPAERRKLTSGYADGRVKDSSTIPVHSWTGVVWWTELPGVTVTVMMTMKGLAQQM